MSDYEYCEACEELREQDPELIVNGFSDENCKHMQNDEGLTGDYDDCTDLNKLNDCLIGIMDAENEVSAMCDWKTYVQKLIPNIWTVFKAVICAICGLWTAVKSYELKKEDGKIVLKAWDGEHGSVTDLDSDTTYTMSISGNTITLTPSTGSAQSVTVPDNNTTYTLSGSGNTVTLTGSDGSTNSHTVTGGGGSGVMMQRVTLPASTVATNTTKTISHAVWPSGTNRKIIGVVGYNFNDETPDTPGTAGVAHFNVFAVEPHSQDDLSVYMQFRNESANNVSYILSITVLYIETE